MKEATSTNKSSSSQSGMANRGATTPQRGWDSVRDNWKQHEHQVRERWHELTDDDIRQLDGDREKLIDRIQQRYNITRSAAERQVDEWGEELMPGGKHGDVMGNRGSAATTTGRGDGEAAGGKSSHRSMADRKSSDSSSRSASDSSRKGSDSGNRSGSSGNRSGQSSSHKSSSDSSSSRSSGGSSGDRSSGRSDGDKDKDRNRD